MGDFRADLDAYFRNPVRENEFGEGLSGSGLWRHALPQVFLNTGLQAVAIYRASRWLHTHRLKRLSRLLDRFNEFACGVELAGETVIGPGFELNHPAGVVIARTARFGHSLTIVGAAVTIGWADLMALPEEQPIEIGDNVTIAAGAKILGPITIGDNVRIGPQCVLMAEDVPDNTTVVNVARQKMLRMDPDPVQPEPDEKPTV